MIKQGGKWYTDGIKTIKIFDGDTIPDGFRPGVHYKHAPWNKGKTTLSDPRVKANGQATRQTRLRTGSYVPWNKGKTKDTDERLAKCSHSGKDNPMYGKHPEAWNKGKTAENDEAMRRASENHKGCTAWNKGKKTGSFWTAESLSKRYETQKRNGTLGVHSDTKAEVDIYTQLVALYGEEDVVKQYFDKERYPFKCDFYIKSIDKFIEVHACWTHGGMPYDPDNPQCQEILSVWKEKALTSEYYKNAIYTWTDLDVRKARIASENNLNYEVIYYQYKSV